MNIIDKLKLLGVEVTEEVEKALSGDWVSKFEMDKKLSKMQELEEKNKELVGKQETLEKELQALKDSTPDADALNQKISELTATLESERKERAAKDEKARLEGIVSAFFEDKYFVNDITANAIKAQLVEKLNSDEARGKSISDLFDSIVKDEKGEVKPNILVDEKTAEAQRRRSSIYGRSIQGDPSKMSVAELMKLKNQNPDMDITPYLRKK
jgi:hypothetical protein